MSNTEIIRFPSDTGSAMSAQMTVLHGVAYITVIPTGENGQVVPGGISAQSEQIFTRIEQKLASIGADLRHIAQFTVYLCQLPETRDAFNDVYRTRMPDGHAPMRCAVGVSDLARPEMLVEVSVVAEVPRTFSES